jgi:hypothetical protein
MFHEFFPLLAVLDDGGLVDKYLSELMFKDLSLDPGAALAKVCAKHGWQTFEPQLVALFQAANPKSLPRDARILEHLASAQPTKDEGWSWLCESLAELTVQTLVKGDLDKSEPEWHRPRLDRREILPYLIRALAASGQATLLAKVIAHMLALPSQYPLDTFHLPVLAELKAWLAKKVTQPNAAFSDWIAMVRESLERLTIEMPQEPTDFRRPASATCKCAHCAELNRFLADANDSVHRFRVGETHRNHLQHSIRNGKCDLDCKTEKTGSPHTLVCTKNTNSYHDALKKYHEDLKHLAMVRESEAALPK